MKNTNSKNKQSAGIEISFILLTLIAIFASASTVSAQSTYSAPVIGVSLLNQNPLPANAGDIVTLRFEVDNIAEVSANNIHVTFKPVYPFTLASGDGSYNLSLGAYSQGDNSAVISFTVKVAKDIQRTSYPVTIEYGRGIDLTTASYDIATQNQEYAQVIFVNKAEISPGKETELNFTINNVGSAPLENMVFSWNEPTGVLLPVYSDNTRYIKYLDVGQSTTLTYNVIADTNANQGLYKLNLNLQYETSGNATPTTLTTTAGIFVGGQTDFDVAFSESTAGQTSLSVSNTGNNPAYSVSVKIPPQNNYRVQGSTSAIIGNLDKGDYTLVSFQIASATAQNFTAPTGGTSAGGNRQTPSQANTTRQFNRTGVGSDNNLLVTIQYTDTTGSRIEVNKTVPIQFKASTTSTTGTTGTAYGRTTTTNKFIGGTLFWIILVVIAGAAGFFIARRKSKDIKKIGK